MPQKLAGIRIDPAPSVPTASGPSPAATAAPEPPDAISHAFALELAEIASTVSAPGPAQSPPL